MSESDSESQTEVIKSKEVKKKDDLLNRREARRRKILENAKNRLDKLSGADSGASINNRCNNHSTEQYSDPEIEHPEFINSYSQSYTTKPGIEATPNHVEWNNSPQFNMPTKTPPTKIEKFLSTRMHILACSSLTYLLLVSGLSAFISHSLILFITLECLELVIFRLDRPLSPIENVVLMMCGINVAKAKVVIKVVGLFKKLVGDLGQFVFVFVITHGLYSWLFGSNDDEMIYSF